MLTTSQVITYLKSRWPSISFFNETIDKSSAQCVGVYTRGSVNPIVGLSTPSSYAIKPMLLLVHWTEDAAACEAKAQEIYSHLSEIYNAIFGGAGIVSINMLDSHPVGLGRDEKNICEFSIRFNIIYRR